jgi:hypothetical protein
MSDGKDQHVTVVSVGRLCVVSLLFGVMIASLLPILLNVASLERKADILMMPGGIFASLLAPAAMVPHPMLLLTGNAIFYALCLFGLCLAVRGWLTASTVRLGTWAFGFAAVILFALACVPRFDPWLAHLYVFCKRGDHTVGRHSFCLRTAGSWPCVRPSLALLQDE